MDDGAVLATKQQLCRLNAQRLINGKERRGPYGLVEAAAKHKSVKNLVKTAYEGAGTRHGMCGNGSITLQQQ
jgi:hypothetical protein